MSAADWLVFGAVQAFYAAALVKCWLGMRKGREDQTEREGGAE